MQAQNVNDENTTIAHFLGAPVPLFDVPGDIVNINLYNLFKPAILHFFHLLNHASDKDTDNNFIHKNAIINVMRMIRLQNGTAFLQNAHNKGLIPTPFSPDDDYYDRWFDDLFSGEPAFDEYKLSIIVQGGEAVNFYSFYKYENVPTHDADTRVLAGEHFNYLVTLADIDATAKEFMHKYRFLIGFGLQSVIDDYDFAMRQANVPDDENLIRKFGFDPDRHTFRAVPKLRGHEFKELVNHTMNPMYNINLDINIERLLSIEIEVEDDVDGEMGEYGLVDIFCPYKRTPASPADTRVGQSDEIFSLFSSPQASSISNPPAPVVPAGHVPSVNFQLRLPMDLPVLGNKEISLRILPHGYTMFETLRMLYVADALVRNGIPYKYEKYKQKLTVLLSTLMDERLSEFIFIQSKEKKSRDEQTARILVGGREALAMDKIEVEPVTLPTKALTMNPRTPMIVATEQQKEARKYSLDLLNEEEMALEKGTPFVLPDRKSLNETQQMGYLDYLSYQYPEMKEFRLPRLPEEFVSHKNKIKTKRGGYRKVSLKKNKPKSRRVTYRK
jgi:hypothetical protein